MGKNYRTVVATSILVAALAGAPRPAGALRDTDPPPGGGSAEACILACELWAQFCWLVASPLYCINELVDCTLACLPKEMAVRGLPLPPGIPQGIRETDGTLSLAFARLPAACIAEAGGSEATAGSHEIELGTAMAPAL